MMTPAAAESWAGFFARPMLGMLIAQVSGICSCGTFMLIQFSRPSNWSPVWHIPTLIGTLAGLIRAPLLWRHGPAFNLNWPGQLTVSIPILAGCMVNIPPYLMGNRDAPFSNRFQFVAWHGVHVFSGMLHQLGSSSAERPPVPHTSNVPLFLAAGMRTLKLLDPLTDMTLIRVLYEEVRSTTEQSSLQMRKSHAVLDATNGSAA